MGMDMAIGRPMRWFRRRAASERRFGDAEECRRAIEAAGRLERLRPLVPRSGRCLPYSLLLLHFLKLRGVEADWVFGVRTHPFEAHCWVDVGGVVLNDSLEHVRWFTPIAIA
jgi:hypothetical protein